MPFPYPFPIIFGVWPAMAVVIQDEIQDIKKYSIGIDSRIEERSIASFTIADTAGSQSYEWGEPIRIFDPTDTLVYSGFIAEPVRVSMSPDGGLYHPIRCKDNHFLADKRLVIGSWSATDVDVIVTALHTDYLADEGVGIGAIQGAGINIAEAVLNYTTVAQALDGLAEYAGYTWFIDENKDLYFVDRTTYAAPWSADEGDMIKGSARWSGGNPLYRNRQYIRGGTALTSTPPAAGITEQFLADGTAQAFTVGFPIALEPTITDSILGARTVGIKGVEAGFDYYWNKNDATVYADVIPVAGRTVTVVYYGLYPLITLSTDEVERVARQAIEGGTGITENIVDEGYHETADSSSESGAAKIAQYCRGSQKFNYRTTTSGLKPGQLQNIDYPLLGINTEDMLIESVRISTIGLGNLFYDITAVTGPVTGSWTRFFSSMARRTDAMLHVGDDYLLAILSGADILALAESTSLASDDFTGGLVNRWLNSAPIDSGSLCNVQHERLDLAEAPALGSHATENYLWDDATALYSFATWG